MAPFFGLSSTASRLEPLQGGSLLFTTNFPDFPVSSSYKVGVEVVGEQTLFYEGMYQKFGIPQSIKQIDLQKTVLKFFEKTDATVDLYNDEACHRLKSDDHG